MTTMGKEERKRSIEKSGAELTQLRVAASDEVCDLADQYNKLVGQVNDTLQQLRRAVTSAREVFDLKELAFHTGLKLSDLTGWAEGAEGKTSRSKSSSRPAKERRHDRRAASEQPGQPSAPRPPLN